MKKIGLLLVIINTTLIGFAGNFQQIRGIVKDAENDVPLAGASIKLLDTPKGVLTDEKGAFSFDMTKYPNGIKAVVSFAGYESDTVAFSRQTAFYTLHLQPATGLLKEVVVTVGGRTLVKESPITMTMVSPKKIDQTLQSNIIDVLVKNVPGLNAVKTGPNISKPFIRGLGYNRVLTLYDGIRQEGQQWGDEHGIEIDPYGIEKAEVTKGPVSLIYGSDALAGVVSMIPFTPTDQDGKIHGRLTSEYQQNNGLIGNGLRLYSGTQNWYWMASGSYQMAKNYQNAADGRVYNTNFKQTAGAFTLGHSSAAGRSSLSVTLFNDLQGIPDGSRDSLTRKFTKQIYEGDEDDIKSRPVVTDKELSGYNLSPLLQHIQHYRIYTNNHYRIGNGNVDASLAWQQNIRQEYSHPAKRDLAGMNVRLNTINYGLKYAFPLLKNTNLTIGTNGMYQDNKNKAATDFPIPDYHLMDVGAFAFGKWNSGAFTLNGGARLDHRKVKGTSFYVKTDPATGFDSKADKSDPDASLQFPAFTKDFNGLSWSLGGTFAVSNHISVKVNIAQGYRSPNITELASNGLDPGAHIIYIGNKAAVPEIGLEEDLGVEADYKDITASVSFFHNHISHYIYLTEVADEKGSPVLDPQGNKTLQYQQTAACLYGVEINVSLHPYCWKGFSWNNNFALTYGDNTSAEFQGKGTKGEYLPYIPPANWLSTITQVIDLKGTVLTSMNLMAEVNYNAAQNRFLGLYGTETATPAYTLINVAAGASIQYSRHHRLEVQLAVNNLWNTVYQSNMSRLKYFEYYDASPNGYYGIYGMGRNICAKLILPL